MSPRHVRMWSLLNQWNKGVLFPLLSFTLVPICIFRVCVEYGNFVWAELLLYVESILLFARCDDVTVGVQEKIGRKQQRPQHT